jgi:hypothetical protein
VSDALQRVFAGTPLGTVVQKLASVVAPGNGTKPTAQV